MTTTRCRRPRPRKSLNILGIDVFCRTKNETEIKSQPLKTVKLNVHLGTRGHSQCLNDSNMDDIIQGLFTITSAWHARQDGESGKMVQFLN